jgi:hypothetical protein
MPFVSSGDALYTPGDVALLAGVSSAYIRLEIRNGRIPVERRTVRGGALLSRAAVESYCLARNAKKAIRE